jgi:hypothetical protein
VLCDNVIVHSVETRRAWSMSHVTELELTSAGWQIRVDAVPRNTVRSHLNWEEGP